jgi:hypothetical protein
MGVFASRSQRKSFGSIDLQRAVVRFMLHRCGWRFRQLGVGGDALAATRDRLHEREQNEWEQYVVALAGGKTARISV